VGEPFVRGTPPSVSILIKVFYSGNRIIGVLQGKALHLMNQHWGSFLTLLGRKKRVESHRSDLDEKAVEPFVTTRLIPARIAILNNRTGRLALPVLGIGQGQRRPSLGAISDVLGSLSGV